VSNIFKEILFYYYKMNQLDKYLSNNKTITKKEWKKIYENYEDFELDFNFLKDTLYPEAKYTEETLSRYNQVTFRKALLKKFDNKCVVSNIDCEDELEAAHIVPFCEDNEFNINNGLILSRNLHATFDKYHWSINPDTLKVEIKADILKQKKSSILEYNNKKIDLDQSSIDFLKNHYQKFLQS